MSSYIAADCEMLKQVLAQQNKVPLGCSASDALVTSVGNWGSAQTQMTPNYQPYTTTATGLGGVWGFGTATQEAYLKVMEDTKKVRTLKDVVAEEVAKLKNIK